MRRFHRHNKMVARKRLIEIILAVIGFCLIGFHIIKWAFHLGE